MNPPPRMVVAPPPSAPGSGDDEGSAPASTLGGTSATYPQAKPVEAAPPESAPPSPRPLLPPNDERTAETVPRATVSASQRPPVDFFDGGRYEVRERLGKGALAEGVFRAWDTWTRTAVALKFLDVSTPEELERARIEASGPRRFGHPGIVRVFDLRQEGNRVAVVMELVEGDTLEKVLEEAPGHRLSARQVTELARDLLEALAALHDNQILHCDLKPANIIIRAKKPVIVDFNVSWDAHYAGIASSDDGNVVRPRRDTVHGTPKYMPLEQFCGHPLTRSSDLFALALILYEAIEGELPDGVANLTIREVGEQRRFPASPFSARSTPMPAAFKRAILRCLDPDPAKRFQSAREFLEALSTPEERPTWAHRFARHRRMIAVATIATLAAAVLVVQLARRATLAAALASQGLPAAVYGFAPASHAPEEEWLGVALGELLQADLEASHGLTLLPRELVSTMQHDLGLAEGPPPDEASARRAFLHTPIGMAIEGTVSIDGASLTVEIVARNARDGAARGHARAKGSVSQPAAVLEQAALSLRQALKLPSVPADELRAAREMLPRDAEATQLYSQGIAKLRSYDLGGARRLLQAAVEREPTHASSYVALAQIDGRLEDEATAFRHWQEAEQHGTNLPEDQKVLIKAGRLEAEGDAAQAANLYRPVATSAPNSLSKALVLARFLVNARKLDEAEAVFRALEKRIPSATSDASVLLVRAHIAYLLHDDANSLALATAAVAQAQTRGTRALLGRAYLDLGTTLAERGRFDEARESLQLSRENFEIIGDAAAALPVRIRLAELEEDEGHFAVAARAHDENRLSAIGLNVRGAAAWSLIRAAICYRLVGDVASTRTRVQELEAEEGSLEATTRVAMLVAKANLELMVGDTPRAHETLAKLENRLGRDEREQRAAADALLSFAYEEGEPAAGVALAEYALGRAERPYARASAALALGILLAQTGRYDEADAYLSKAPVDTWPSPRDEIEVARAYVWALAGKPSQIQHVLEAPDAAWKASERREVQLLGLGLLALAHPDGTARVDDVSRDAHAAGLLRVEHRLARAARANDRRVK